MLASATPAAASVITVTTLADSLATTGCSLRAAILAASTDTAIAGCVAGEVGGDRIELGPGVHGLTLVGAGEDAGLTGDLDVRGVLEIVGAGRDSSFIQWDGVADDRLIDVVPGAALTLSDLTLRHGLVVGRGGVMRVDGNATLQDCAVLEGTADFGGGIGLGNAARLTVTRCEIANNRGDGGGIAAGLRSSLVVGYSLIHHNQSQLQGGGGIHGGFADVVVEDSEITDNIADDSRWGGGGLLLQGGSLQLRRSTLADNSAGDALANGSTSHAQLDESGGGGISLRGALAEIENATISGNRSDQTLLGGGGVLAVFGDLRLAHATLVRNESDRTLIPTTGGTLARWDHDRPDAELFLSHSLVTATGPLCFATAAITGIGNRVDDASCGEPIDNLGPVTGLDPTLAANGGPTRTHPLLAGSNALDAGPAICFGTTGLPLSVGQRGVARPQNGACDLGAIEVAPDAIFGSGFESL